MLKICQNYAKDIPKIWQKIIFSVIKTGLGFCYSTLSQRAKICSIYAQDMPKLCSRYAKTMPDISQRYDQKLYLVLLRLGWGYATELYPREPKYVLYMLKTCQNNAQDIPKLCRRYSEDMTNIYM